MLIPILAIMWGDLQAALIRAEAVTQIAIKEIKKTQELRAQILLGTTEEK
jgi:hypothetical protein